ncbi:hypothetical protein KHQ88_03490 [Mycoplasmatota bacterium]|nr:hypothetical protein KHQ88_03490 [Mycoplasmatota bacterium]
MDKDNYNTKNYKEKYDKSSQDELSFFANFHHNIEETIHSNRQITINNLNSIHESLNSIRQKTKQMTDKIINHDEDMIIQKQKVIRNALVDIHKNNVSILNFESDKIKDRVFSIDYLHNQLINENLDYYKTYKFFFDSTIDIINDNNSYLKNKNQTMNYVIEKHFKEITDEFNNIDHKISDIDETIKNLISTKSHKEDILDEFFDIEIKNLIESQINFSTNEDPYSSEIQKMTHEKERQYNQYSEFLLHQENRLKNQLIEEIETKYNDLYHRKYKLNHNQSKAEKYAHKKIKTLIRDKKNILFQFKENNLNALLTLDKSLKLYLNLYKTDPFLAQLYSDKGASIIHKEIEFTRLYKMNKALKYHIYFTYKLVQLNHQIKTYEYQLVHFIESKFASQELDVLNIIKDIHSYLLDSQAQIDSAKVVLKRDKQYIVFLNELINEYVDYHSKIENLNRKFLSEFSNQLNQNVYKKSDIDTEIINASSDIRLALKESEVETLHYKTLFEHEKRMLLIQQKRIESETEINYKLISETYLNQMRFAKEQIKLADDDLKMRLTSIVHNIDNERIHFYDMITHEVKLKEDASNHNFFKYQKDVYDIIHAIENTNDLSLIKKLEKELKIVKNSYHQEINHIISKYRNNEKIQLYQKRLDELDMYLEDSYHAASEIHDETIREMDEIYRYSQAKYQEFIDSVDKSAHPLDDFLYESLQKSKKRLHEKLKYAEITLDTKIGHLLENYKTLYFKLKYEVNSSEIVKLLDAYQKDKEEIKNTYHHQLSNINEKYFMTIDSLNNQIRHIQVDYEALKNNVISEKNSIIKNKINEINHSDTVFNEFIKKTNKKNKETLNKLLETYLSNIELNSQFYDELQNDYSQLVDSFGDYIKYSKKTPNIKKVIHHTLRLHKKEKRRKHKLLKKEKKHFDIF